VVLEAWAVQRSGTPTITVNLTGVTDVQRITVTLNSVSDGTNTGNIPIFMGVLGRDVNGNNAVNSTDVAQTKSQVGQPVMSSNFREDVNAVARSLPRMSQSSNPT